MNNYILKDNCFREKKENYNKVKEFLLKRIGNENAIASHHLAHIFNIKKRTIRLIIKDMIKQGYPVLSLSGEYKNGYFIPNNMNELNAFLNHRKSIIKKLKDKKEKLKSNFKNNENLSINPDQRKVYFAINTGYENSITMKEISNKTNIYELKEILDSLFWDKNYCIASTDKGFFIPVNEDEVNLIIKNIDNKIKNIQNSINKIEVSGMGYVLQGELSNNGVATDFFR